MPPPLLTISPIASHTSLVGCPCSSKAACCGATTSAMNLLTEARHRSCGLALPGHLVRRVDAPRAKVRQAAQLSRWWPHTC